MKELIEIINSTPIEIVSGVDQEGKTTAKKLYEFLELDKKNYSRECKSKIEDNEFAIENIDYVSFVINEEWGGQATKDFKLTASFAKKLAMGTHNEKGEQAKEYFLKVEERLKQKSSTNIDISQLSPELQMFNQIFNSLATHQLKQKEIERQLEDTNGKIENIKEVIEIRPSNSWRGETNRLMTKICFKLKDYQKSKEKAYKALQERAGCDLKIRLKRMRERLTLQGVAKSKLDELNYLDVIEQNKKLIEIYIDIVKDMTLKYGFKRIRS